MANPFQGDDVDPFSAVRDDEGATKRSAEKKKSFKEAFADARKSGDKTFEWNGKKYSTNLAAPKSKKTDSAMSKADFLTMEADSVERERARGANRKYDPQLANRIAIAKDAANTRSSQEGQFGSFSKGGKVKGSSASKRADGCAVRGKTKGRMV